MGTSFSRSLRSVEGDGGRVLRWLVAPVVVALGLWGWWLAAAEVPLYAASTTARLVQERAVHPLQSEVDGRVLAVHVALDEPVEAGAVVVELDPGARRLALAEERARLDALSAEIASSRAALAALEAAGADALEAARTRRREAELELASREIDRALADEEADRYAQLESTGDISRLVTARAQAEAERAEVAVRAQEAVLERLAQDARADDADRAAARADAERGLAALLGARAVGEAAVERLLDAIDRCTVRAPAAGRVGELADLVPGRYVVAGESLGAVVSESRLAAEAGFAPAEALGRVRPGQRGELSLSGFPRAQYGSLDVLVERVASEARDGLVRVEFSLPDPDATTVPLDHGLPGAIRIEVERASPLALVMRAVGGTLGSTGRAGSGRR